MTVDRHGGYGRRETDSADLPPGSWPRLHDFARWLASWIFFASVRVRVHCRARIPRTGPLIVVANHSSNLDGPLLFGLLRRRTVFLVKREMFHGPLAWALPKIGQLAVRRGEPDRAPLLAAVQVLRGGGTVGVFPEGTRGSGAVAQARNGAAWLARTTSAVVLPVACRGTAGAAGAGASRRFRRRVDVLIGEPFLMPIQRGRAGLAAATEQIRTSLAALVVELDRLRAGMGEPPEAAAAETVADPAASSGNGVETIGE